MYRKEYYSALKKKNEIMSLAATWMDPEIVLLRQRRINTYCMISVIFKILKNGTNELIYKTEIELLMQKTILWLPGRKGHRKGKIGSLGLTYTPYHV